MELDWFTVAAQIGNFLLLLWLLKRFLYRPILDAMAARQQRIDAALTEAQTKAADAEALQRDYLARQQELGGQPRDLAGAGAGRGHRAAANLAGAGTGRSG